VGTSPFQTILYLIIYKLVTTILPVLSEEQKGSIEHGTAF
jgi:hypothetical protein